MIDAKLAQEFITNLCDSTDYKAQIIDYNGFILASYDMQNIGVFHESSYQMLRANNSLSAQYTKTAEPGILSVYVSLMQDQALVGMLEITGDEKKVKIYANVLKLSLETMFDHDLKTVKFQKYSSKFDLFMQKILYDPQVSRAELESRASSLGFSFDCMRIPVFIVTDQYTDFSALIQQGKTNPHYNSQDILALSRSGNITLFIYLGYGEEILRSYRDTVSEYLSWWQETFSSMGLRYYMQVGTIQTNLAYYRIAYEHAVWLHNTARLREPISWFYDYTESYLKRIVPMMEYRGIFNVFAENLNEDFLASYTELIGSLAQCNYNLQPASQQIYIHKNTLAFRLGKIKDRLNINPMHNYRNREFANNLCLYLKMMLP